MLYQFQKNRKATSKEIFENIYANQMWGKGIDTEDTFYSGHGSHRSTLVSMYIPAVENFIKEFDQKLDVVDLGCGDFAVGSQVRKNFNSYIACDVVEPLIERNKDIYKDLNVDFRVLDIVTQELPCGDVAIIRQVFQHLSNKQITKVIPKLIEKYKYIIVTEHLPASNKFKANMDLMEGPDIRLGFDSGIVLTKPPFNLKIRKEDILCEILDEVGIIRTIAYTVS
ncbi:MAG: class I SAM-dependent methyltransferase [Saprospiraceae bacterium]